MIVGVAAKGGGMRGEITLRFLMDLERYSGRPIWEKINFGGGTSTGAIIMVLMLCGLLSPAAVEEAYRKLGKIVFPWQLPGYSTAKHAATVKHDIRDLVKCLGDLLVGKKLGDAVVPLLIPTADANSNQTVHLKSYDPTWMGLAANLAAAASAAAPTYFKALECLHSGFNNRFIDGGLFANNPSDNLRFEMEEHFHGGKFVIISVGTGRPSPKITQPWPDGGLIKWGGLIFNATSLLQDHDVSVKLQRRLKDDYINLDVDLDRIPPMDDASDAMFDYLNVCYDNWMKRDEGKALLERALVKLNH